MNRLQAAEAGRHSLSKLMLAARRKGEVSSEPARSPAATSPKEIPTNDGSQRSQAAHYDLDGYYTYDNRFFLYREPDTEDEASSEAGAAPPPPAAAQGPPVSPPISGHDEFPRWATLTPEASLLPPCQPAVSSPPQVSIKEETVDELQSRLPAIPTAADLPLTAMEWEMAKCSRPGGPGGARLRLTGSLSLGAPNVRARTMNRLQAAEAAHRKR
ncbi:hypothetical protein BC940DRAFT_333513 [Gongronella butleri]|nr:hypothetical protein BC940DRAFT_333513 [Gongronella butleri]